MQTFGEIENTEEDNIFYDNLANCFAQSIFTVIGIEKNEELSAPQLEKALLANQQNAAILEMLVGESLIDLDSK